MTKHTGRGLYRESFERDSCGFGLIASLDDKPSHWLGQTAISSLNRLTHRGAIATDGKTGVGCGVLLKKPEKFLRAVARDAKIKLSPRFASGLLFLNTDRALAALARAELKGQLEREGLQLAGIRLLPTVPDACGPEALKTLPHIEQVFVNCRIADIDEASFNRKLFLARRRTEKALEVDPQFYCPSLSASTIVYKGMVMPEHLARFYPDLADPRLEASVAVFHQRFSTNRPLSSKLRETLGQVQQNEINNRLRLSADYLRTGKGTAAAMRDAVTTQALNNLRDQLREIQKSVGSGQQGAGDKDRQALEEALAQTERLRKEMERGMQSGRPSRDLPSRAQGAPRQGAGQQPGDSQTAQPGEGQPGQIGPRANGRQNGLQPGPGPAWGDAGDFVRNYRYTLRELENNPQVGKDLRDTIQNMYRLDPRLSP